MNELIQSLIDGSRQEAAHYRQLRLLADQQKELLIGGKVDQLSENTRLEEKEVFVLGPLIAKRNELLGKMAKAHGAQTLSLTEALQKAPVEMIEDFKAAVIELIHSARQLEECNQGNEKLLQNALSYVDFTLKAIASGGKKKAFSPSTTKEENVSSFVDRII